MNKAQIVIGLAYGDESKGATVDFLTRHAQRPIIIRYNGGCQAAHNVVTPEGTHHRFQQFGAGMFVPYARTFLSRFMMVEPFQLLSEERKLASLTYNPGGRTFIDGDAQVILPLHRTLNQLRELHRRLTTGDVHGSTGQGIGEAAADALSGADVMRVRDLQRSDDDINTIIKTTYSRLYSQMKELANSAPMNQEFDQVKWSFNLTWVPGFLNAARLICDTFQIVDTDWLAEQNSDLIFEGAQGVMLDQDHPVNSPHVTWSKTTSRNAETILSEIDFQGEVKKLGLIRSYLTRHGAGPLPTEDPLLLKWLPERHNGTGRWQGAWRVGRMDHELVRHSIEYTGGIDGLCISHLDVLRRDPHELADLLGVPLFLTARGPTWKDRSFAETEELRSLSEDLALFR